MPLSSRNRKRAVTGVLAVLLLGAVSCRDGKESQPDGGRIEVNVAVSLCRSGGAACTTVRLPEVDVTVKLPNGFTETKKTDANGVATFTRTVAGTGTITAHSDLLSADVAEEVTTSRGADRTVVELVDPKPILTNR